jgi:hypothetical protein
LCGGGGERRDHGRKVDYLRKKDGERESRQAIFRRYLMNLQEGVVYGNWGPGKRIG